MANIGYRSIEVLIENYTQADLTIQGAAIGTGASWVQGEAPQQGGTLQQYGAMVCGAYTNDTNGSASFQLTLTGYGDTPVEIAAMNDENGVSAVHTIPNNKITATVTVTPTGEANHTMYNVQLTPLLVMPAPGSW